MADCDDAGKNAYEAMSLKKRKVFDPIWLIFLIGLAGSFAGCVSDDSSSGMRDELMVTTQEEEQYDDRPSLTPADGLDPGDGSSSLAGSCPFGNHCCGSPGCSMWTDLNNDGCCDLGVQAS